MRLLGSTSAAPILGLSPWMSAHDLWRRLRGYDAPTSPAMIRGLACEPHLARRVAALAGVDLQPVEPVVHPHGVPYLRVSGDYCAGRTGYELKTSGYYAHERWTALPAYYEVQAVLEAWAFDWDEVIVPALVVPSAFGALEAMTIDMEPVDRDNAIWAMAPVIVHAAEIQVYRVERDDAYAEAIVRLMGAWWQRHIVEGVEPAVTATDAWRDYARVHLPEREPLRPAEVDEIALAERYDEARRRESEAREAKEAIGAELRRAIGTAAGIKTGHGYAVARAQSPRTDWKAAATELRTMLALRGVGTDDVIARHTKPAEGRTLDVKIKAAEEAA